MSRGLLIGYGVVLVVALVGLGLLGDKEEADVATLLAADNAFAALSRAEGPKAAFAAYMVDDALQLPAGRGPVYGGATIASGFDGVPDMTLDWAPEEGGVAKEGDMGWTWGRYTATSSGENGEMVSSHGKYLNIWIKDDEGNWRVLVDMGNSSKM